MSELSREGRALLTSVRGDLDASEAERERIGRALATRIGIAAGALVGTTSSAAAGAAGAAGIGAASALGAATAAGSATGVTAAGIGAGAAASGASAAMIVGAKWLGATLLVAAVGVGGSALYESQRRPDGAPASPAAAPAISATRLPVAPPPTVTAPKSPTAATVDTRGTTIAPVPPSGSGSRGVLSASAPPGARPIAPTNPPRVQQEPGSSAAEIARPPETAVSLEAALLRHADEALRSGDAALAERFLSEHARAFPTGILSEERSALRVTTLCTLGRIADARVEAQRFLGATPDSPLASTVRKSCGAREEIAHP